MSKEIICGYGWSLPAGCPNSPTQAHSCGKKVSLPDSIAALPDNKNKRTIINRLCNKHKCGYCKAQL